MIKSNSNSLPSCLIRTDSAELSAMISAILAEQVHTVAVAPADILITVECDFVTVSRGDGTEPVVMDRPIRTQELRQAVIGLAGICNAPSFSADPSTRSAILGNKSVRLTDTEFRLYSAILENDDFATANDISLKVWGRPDRNLCTVYLSYLRRKLDSAFGVGTLITVSGKGYRLRNTKVQ